MPPGKMASEKCPPENCPEENCHPPEKLPPLPHEIFFGNFFLSKDFFNEKFHP